MPSPNLIRVSQLPVADPLTGLERLPLLQYGLPRSARVGQILGERSQDRLDLETPFYEPQAGGRVALRADRSVHLVSAFGGAVDAVLPLARELPGRVMVVKKTDASANPVTITAEERTVHLAPRPAAAGGKIALDGVGTDPAPIAPLDPPAVPDPDPTIGGLDGQAHVLAARYDFVMAISNGTDWQIIAGGWQQALDDRLDLESVSYAPAEGGVIGLAADRSVHLIDATGGTVEAQLPAPGDVPTRVIIVKKIDGSANAVTVTTTQGGGPDGAALALSDPGDNVTVISDGSTWHVWSRDPIDQETFRHDLTIVADSPTLTLDSSDGGPAGLAVFNQGSPTGDDLTYSPTSAAWTVGAEVVWHGGNFALPAAAGYGIAEKQQGGAWVFRGLGTGDPEFLLRLADGDARYAPAGSGGLDADLQAIADAAGYGILEKQSPTEGDWGFRGLGTGDGAHLLRRSDGDARYVQAASIATVALTGNYDDLINAINKGVISAMEQRITDLENAVFGT